MGELNNLTAYERQQILDYCKTWNLGQENTGDNSKKATSTKDEINLKIKQLQSNLDSNKKRLASLPDGNDFNDNSVYPYDPIKGGGGG